MANQEERKAATFSQVPETDRSRLIAARRHSRDNPASRDKATRERESDLGGVRLQLDLNGLKIEGHHLYWANDEDGYVERLLMEGFDFITQDELHKGKPQVVEDLDLSSCVSKFVKGTRVDGQALRAYALKIPEEQWAEREKTRHAAADRRDYEIYSRANNPGDGFYKPNGTTTVIDPSYRKTYK